MKQHWVILSLLLVCACVPKNKIYEMDADAFDYELLDTLVVSAPKESSIENDLPEYRASSERLFDLIHTRLDLSFNWEKQHVIGRAWLQLKPYFYPTNVLTLDAKNFDIYEVSLNGKTLKYQNSFDKLYINLEDNYTRKDTLEIFIDYTAKPNEGPEGGSQAIQSDKGLFFINPLGLDDKPQQIWTQGETENNSKWFPTIDKPNERCTQEIFLTVDDRFKTLSNGTLISSKKNENGTRTDYWKQELPHAPYLFMLAIGEYAVVEDEWNGLPLYYYVEKDYASDAKYIFNHTPEMLSFFSQLLNYPYPWDKYAQVVCRDFVSGAMENTGAVIFGEFVQRTQAELVDEPNDYIVAHELIHHWFGNIVTCESWANLTLNEGFANYGEYLWFEYKYGHDFAENHRLNELNGYFNSAFNADFHPLIHFNYDDKEDMFDAHSYNKGGLVLHMLRNIIGDEAFFEALNLYLTQNAFSAVEADELRLAFEEVTGRDLNWFFDQWFFNQGHPTLEVNYAINEDFKDVLITVDQVQNPVNHLPIYTMPVEIAMYYSDGSVDYIPWTINQRNTIINIPFGNKKPEVVVLDGKHSLVAAITENRTNDEYVKLFNYSRQYLDQYNAINNLKFEKEFDLIKEKALKHDFYYFRNIAVNNLENESYISLLKDILISDENANVRASAFDRLVMFEPKDAIYLSQSVLKTERSYSVLGQAIRTLYELDPDSALIEVDKIAAENPKPFLSLISDIYAASEEIKYLDFFKDNIERVSIYELWNFTKLYVDLAEFGSSNDMVETALTLDKNIPNSGNMKKTLLMYNMGRIYKKLSKNEESSASKVKGMMEEVIALEKDRDLADQFRSYLN